MFFFAEGSSGADSDQMGAWTATSLAGSCDALSNQAAEIRFFVAILRSYAQPLDRDRGAHATLAARTAAQNADEPLKAAGVTPSTSAKTSRG